MEGYEAEKAAKSLIEVKVAPKKNPSRWNWFFKFLKRIEKNQEVQKVKAKVTEYVEANIEGGIESAKHAGLANQKMQADIQQVLNKTQMAEDENRRKNSEFELQLKALDIENMNKEMEIRKTEAEAKKLEAEARKIEADTSIRLLDEMEKRGFQAGFDILEDGTPRLVVINKPSEQAYIDDDLEIFDDQDNVVDPDESATKLDLARAYINMGDSEGAVEILREVLNEGTVQQKYEAHNILRNIDNPVARNIESIHNMTLNQK